MYTAARTLEQTIETLSKDTQLKPACCQPEEDTLHGSWRAEITFVVDSAEIQPEETINYPAQQAEMERTC